MLPPQGSPLVEKKEIKIRIINLLRSPQTENSSVHDCSADMSINFNANAQETLLFPQGTNKVRLGF